MTRKHKHNHTPHPQNPQKSQHSHRPLHSNRRNRGQFPKPNRTGDRINYHVLKCRPIINQNSPQIQHDHLQVLLEIDSGTRYWMTINIRSGQDQVLYSIDENYQHPITQRILDANLLQGFTALDKKPGGLSLDYIREQLVDLKQMDELQKAGDPEDEGIADMLTTQLVNVMRAPDARLFVFGSKFDDGARFSSFDLDIGIHDIHMNQGSKGAHASSNGIYQDGALLAFYPSEHRWSAVFLKFASQAEKTDDAGNASS
ncbi:MAG: YukJ family protein [Scytolyngbya sp. HA4215-MV1]|jgi:uncharacterized protein YukJ|nr:YukJ family protein [Scytolyngbya sp. HA4215-MV1]